MENVKSQVVTDKYAIYEGDSCEVMKSIPDDSIDFGVHSPPFSGLYKFSNSDRDVSNSEGDDFFFHYGVIIGEMLRITKPGRNHSVHVMQLPTTKGRDGYIGIKDFRGEVVRAYQAAGWQYVSEVCIWKDPVVAQQRTKSIRLLHKQVVKDSTISGQGLADYVLTFRKPGVNEKPVAGAFDVWVGEGDGPNPGKWTDPNDARNWFSIEIWQKLASPVWMDIRQSRTLQYRKAKDKNDEQHISPLQLDVIERCIQLWSNVGDVVFTPFLGIGSEVFAAVEMERFGMGIELKASYFKQAVKNCAEATSIKGGLLDAAE